MNKEITTPQSSQADPTGVVLQQEKEGDTSSHLIAGLVAAEFGVTLTANWLLSASVTSTTASLGYIGVAVFAWGTGLSGSIPTPSYNRRRRTRPHDKGRTERRERRRST